MLIPVPPINLQRQIGSILSAYDELMENSQRRIRLLEAMARALYREWFVHFRAPGMGLNHRINSAIGPIPHGWEIKKLGDTFKTVLGGTPSRVKPEYWQDGSIPWINSGKVNDLRITEPSELITKLALERSAAKLMPKGTTVLAITGATLGQVSYLEIETTANQSVVGIVDPSGLYSEWIYLTVTDRIEGIINRASGGAQQHINKEVVSDVLVAPPPAPLAKEFKRLVGPMFREVATLLFKIQNLRRTRDLLLPRLLSGQISLTTKENYANA
jgi:type I restriction enzyme S subunit